MARQAGIFGPLPLGHPPACRPLYFAAFPGSQEEQPPSNAGKGASNGARRDPLGPGPFHLSSSTPAFSFQQVARCVGATSQPLATPFSRRLAYSVCHRPGTSAVLPFAAWALHDWCAGCWLPGCFFWVGGVNNFSLPEVPPVAALVVLLQWLFIPPWPPVAWDILRNGCRPLGSPSLTWVRSRTICKHPLPPFLLSRAARVLSS